MDNQSKAISDGEMSDFVHGRLQPEQALHLLDLIEQDQEASANLDLQVEILNTADSADAEAFRAKTRLMRARLEQGTSDASWLRWHLITRPVLVPTFILVAGVVLGFTVITSILAESDPLGDLAELDDLSSSFRLRGPSSSDLAEAANWLVNGEPEEAARRFERHLNMYPSEEWIPWVEYAAGLSRLAEARRSFLGVRVSYNADRVKRGLDHLEHVLANAENPELKEDALWYKAKGYLMLGDAQNSTVCLSQVRALQGSRSEAARGLLSRLKSLQD
jgi:tetratricopeptide (TPR) repeat protein